VSSDTPTQSSDRLDEIIAEYLAAEESGAAPAPEDVIAAIADLEKELHRFLSSEDEGTLLFDLSREAHIAGTATASVATINMDEMINVPPVVANGVLDIMTRSTLYAIQQERSDE